MDSVVGRRSLTPTRARSLGPESQPRDPMEDTGASGTRKRPRLDSGARSYRSMSADQVQHPSTDRDRVGSPSTPPKPMADHLSSATVQLPVSNILSPSKLPINVRDSSTTTPTPLLPTPTEETFTGTETAGAPWAPSSLNGEDGHAPGSGSSSPMHSPEIEVAEIEDMDGETMETRWRPLGGAGLLDARSTQNDLLMDFPYLDRPNNLIKTVGTIAGVFEKNDLSSHGEVLATLARWIESYLTATEPLNAYWFDLYSDRRDFWDVFPTLIHALVDRRNPKQGTIRPLRIDGRRTHLQSFLVAYSALALRMARIDEQTLQDYLEDSPTALDLVSERWLSYLPIIMTFNAPFWRSTIDTNYYEHYSTILEIIKRFAGSPYDGVKCLANISRLENSQALNSSAWTHAHIIQCVFDCYTHHCPDDDKQTLFAAIPSQGFLFFSDTESQLRLLVSKQVASLSIQSCETLVQRLLLILAGAASGDQMIAKTVLDRAVPTPPEVPLDQQSDLAIHAWKVDLLKKCIMEGRMEIRVYGVENMQLSLVDVYSRYINTRPSNPSHPIANYLADWLLLNRMVEYFVGVESHPQLIARAANIVGFLSVTNRYTSNETDIIWNAITSGQDSSKIEAILKMAIQFFNISSYSALCYFLTRLSQLPIGNFDANMIEYGKLMLRYLRQKWPGDASEPTMTMEPVHLSIRLIRESAIEKSLAAQRRLEIQRWASSELKEMLQYKYADQDFVSIYDECLSDIARHTECATGSVSAITTMFIHKSEDVKCLAINNNLTGLLVSDIAYFTKVELASSVAPSVMPEALDCRFKLLENLIQYAPQSISEELAKEIWNVTVGPNALNDLARGHAWMNLRKIQRMTTSRNAFIERCSDAFLPGMHPSFVVRECVNFAREVDTYRSRFRVRGSYEAGHEDTGLSSGELLWQMSLAIPLEKASVAARSITTFINLYLDSDEARNRGRTANDALHIELVQRCIRQLTTAGSKLRSFSDGTLSGEYEPMVIVTSAEELDAQKLTFSRSLRILQEFVAGIRSRPMYSPEPQSQPPLPKSFHDIKGEAVRLRYQAFGPKPSEIRTLEVGNLETAEELASRLRALTGFTHLRTIVNGHDLDLDNVANQTIDDLGLHAKGLLLIKKAQSPDSVPDLSPRSDLRPVEVEILSHFTELYQLLSLEEDLARLVYTFLSAFPPHQSIISRVCSPRTQLEESFPPAAPFKILYSTFALRACLIQQLEDGATIETLTNQSIPALTATITNFKLDQANVSFDVEAAVATALVECLLAFMKETTAFNEATILFPDPRTLVDRLHLLISRGLTPSHPSSEARTLVGETFAALLEASIRSPEFQKAVVEAAELPTLLQRLLIEETDAPSRQRTATTVHSICSSNTKTSSAAGNLVSYLWGCFAAIIPHCLEFGNSSEHFFEVANAVFRTVDSERRVQMNLDAYAQSWCSLLLRHTHTEFVGRHEIDHLVLGLSRLILYCFQLAKPRNEPLRTPDDFMEALFYKHLFPRISDPMATSKSGPPIPNLRSEVRTHLLDIIFFLSNNKPNYQKLLNLLRELIPLPNSLPENNQAWSHGLARTTDAYTWEPNYNFERSKVIRAEAGHPGLRNLSNTCYMNSLLTQLFMNVKFRAFIVNTHVSDHAGSQKLLNETKRLFAYMQETFLKAVDTQSIADSIVFDGSLIDVTVQMDVDEFYNLLFDRWESQILDESDKKTFRQFYGGQIVQQIKSRECPHISERLEPFFAVQCDITGKSTLKESLDAYVAGEVMEGDNKYSCTSCGTYVEAVKRACLKDIPDNLIFHLKRFDYDLMSGNRNKVNNRFEFPSEIDMAEYLVDNLANPQGSVKSDVFELVGVLVHTGTSESGHYYSYIKERPTADPAVNTWVEFNDMEVTPFDPYSIDDQCFGGLVENQVFMNAQWKSWNAYMLFYERVGCSALRAETATTDVVSVPAKCTIPLDLKAEVDQSNEHFLRQYCLFDPVQANFSRNVLEQLRTVNQSCCTEDHAMEQEAIWLTLEYLDRYQSRTKDCPSHEKMQGTLTRVIGACSQCCRLGLEWVIRHPCALRNLLLRCPIPKVRKDFAGMIITGLQHLRGNGLLSYGYDEMEDMESDTTDTPCEKVGKVFSSLAKRLEEISPTLCYNPRGWDDYFGLLAEMANMGKSESHVLLLEGFLLKCLEILVADSLLAQRMPLRDRYQNYCRLIDKGRKFPLGKLIELLATLLERLDLAQEPVLHRHGLQSYDTGPGPLTNAEDDLIRFGVNRPPRAKDTVIFLDKILTGGSNPQAMKRIVRALVLAEPLLRIAVALRSTLQAGISVDPAVLAGPYLQAALVYCECIPSMNSAESMIQFVATEVDSIKKSGGREHLDFFIQARRLRSLRHDRFPEMFSHAVLKCVPTWAPGLLTYVEESVRTDTLEFLKLLVFNHDINNLDDEEYAEKLARVGKELGYTCAKKCDSEVKKQEPLENPRFYDQVQEVIKHCIKEYFEDCPEADIQAIADVLARLDALSVSDFEDPPSDHWPNSDGDIPSDSDSDQFGASP